MMGQEGKNIYILHFPLKGQFISLSGKKKQYYDLLQQGHGKIMFNMCTSIIYEHCS